MSRNKVFWIAASLTEGLCLLIDALLVAIPWYVGFLGALVIGTVAMGIYEGIKCGNNRTII